ncbi:MULTISPECIES: ATP-dependent RNA helicase DbpA [unclassified Halomonas]|uniref:ATP-dependent RNA helicase DbpA n=1 Tax=unclassified Halomonas TaxID=2609666 RepID=UPI002888C934|nr:MULTISPECIES: ATP-dependent RNA helicase DbpA [unclassified Halomonas]MDT0501723.1 ATP-dependent RNA helicase DbpA [Halomonas sp. PAR7]MDT0513447.1 ATP-dependent RNA helicase DbpA [Halomonas sp. LES1]MDT0591786.1 ATP-dependent RNA helicase DbpA [Halomonas sp. PAR8]
MGRLFLQDTPLSDTPSDASFAALPLAPELLDNLASLGFTAMTPIQAESLPPILAGRDVIAQAKTGSGKTAAFGLGLLSRLTLTSFRVQGLVLCPTRELADQVAVELRRLARSLPNVKILTLCGGAPFGPQLASLEHGAHIVVGTPGRVEEHLRKGSLGLEGLEALVLDEADRMLDMGFQASLETIVAETPASRQTLLFSATFSDAVRPVAEAMLRQPLRVEVAETHDASSIHERVYRVADGDEARLEGLCRLLLHFRPASSVVFCNTKRETDEVAQALNAAGFGALALHGDLEQPDRDRLLVLFANRSASIMVATDVAARGLDIAELDAVFNYHIARDLEVHVHRVGRTGRAGSAGIACTLVGQGEGYRLERLTDFLGETLEEASLPPRSVLSREPLVPPMTTLQISGGKKQKVRPGDILGALTGEAGLAGDQVGKIKVLANSAYVAVRREVADQALERLANGRIKGRSFRARRISR